MQHHTNTTAAGPDAHTHAHLSHAARRVLAHLRMRTITGRFACPLWSLPSREWDAALDELRRTGYPIAWISGQVLDDPAVTGGYTLTSAPRSGS